MHCSCRARRIGHRGPLPVGDRFPPFANKTARKDGAPTVGCASKVKGWGTRRPFPIEAYTFRLALPQSEARCLPRSAGATGGRDFPNLREADRGHRECFTDVIQFRTAFT